MTDARPRTVERFMLVLVGKMATDGITGESGRRIEEALTTEGTDLHRRMRREERFAEDKSRKKMEDISHRCTQIDTDNTFKTEHKLKSRLICADRPVLRRDVSWL